MVNLIRTAKMLALRYPSVAYHLNFTITSPDSQLKIPIYGGMGSSNVKMREDQVAYTINKIMKDRKGVFIDVGTNIGQTLLHVLKCDRERKFVGFDVQVPCIAYIQRLVHVNGLQNVSVYPFGLSNRNAFVDVFIKEIGDLSASVDAHFRRASFYKSTIHGLVRRGDEVVQELGLNEICLIKIDVEGAEADVVEGLRGTLKVRRPHVICEILPSGQVEDKGIKKHRQKNIQRVKSAFEELEYSFYRIKPDLSIEGAKSLDQDAFNLDYCNYLFAPSVLDTQSF